MILSDKSVQEFKAIFKKKYGQDLSDDEARDQGQRLLNFFEILFTQAQTEFRRKNRLKREKVKGFFLDASEGVYTCSICYGNRPGNEIWWTPKSLRCVDCQNNVDKMVIPPLTWDHQHKIWFDSGDIQYNYQLHPATVRKLQRQGVLKGRELKTRDGVTYFTVFLVDENKEFLKIYPKKPKLKVTFENSNSKEV